MPPYLPTVKPLIIFPDCLAKNLSVKFTYSLLPWYASINWPNRLAAKFSLTPKTFLLALINLSKFFSPFSINVLTLDLFNLFTALVTLLTTVAVGPVVPLGIPFIFFFKFCRVDFIPFTSGNSFNKILSASAREYFPLFKSSMALLFLLSKATLPGPISVFFKIFLSYWFFKSFSSAAVGLK